MKPVWASLPIRKSRESEFGIRINGIHALNQRYEAPMGFPGHEPGMNAVWHSPPTEELNDPNNAFGCIDI